jgi:hypothetical protein
MLAPGAGVACIFALSVFLARPARAQLAITEVMSSAAVIDPSIGNRNSDYWELTNFGTNRIDLNEFSFNDADHTFNERTGLVPFGSTVSFIEPHQSIVFVRDNVLSNATQVHAWWGLAGSSNTVVSFYKNPGFSRLGDALILYSRTGEVIDAVRFGEAKPGVSFVYDTVTGEFGGDSVPGEHGAARAATTSDIGSPGRTAGPVPLRILSQPQSLVSYPLLTPTLSVQAIGLPRPRYQWFFNGSILPGETRASLTLSNITAGMAGMYHVEIFNGLTNVVSSNAVVTLNDRETAPRIIAAPQDATVLLNKSARFTLIVEALPLARYQWFFNDVLLPNETGRSLLIPNCTHDAEVRVRAENSLGAVEARARLFVTTKLDLRITEVHAEKNSGCEDHNDWFELTNFGKSDLQLLGYRFSDDRNLMNAVVITEPIVLESGESMICLNNSAVGSFLEWWGVENLPPGLKIFPYYGFSIRASGEALFVWSDTAETDLELVDDLIFSGSLTGISQWFDEDTAPLGEDSVPGRLGAFRALECGDIGSPGYIANPSPRILSVERIASGTRLKWRAMEESRYEAVYSPSLADPWVSIGFLTSTNSIAEMIDTGSINAETRFYQIREVAP